MKIYKLIFSMLLLSTFTFTSCVWKQAATHVAIKKKAFTATVTSVASVNNQFILTGSNLDQVTNVKIKDGSSETYFDIASQSSSQIVVNVAANLTIAAGRILDFIIADAYSAASFSVNFSLCDSTLNGKYIDCTVTANDRDVLSYDAITQTWKPRSVNGLHYLGVSALTGAITEANFPGGAVSGDYYVKSGVGGILTSTTYPTGHAFSSGDWFVFSDSSTWEIVTNGKNGVASFKGRIGAVVPNEGDYGLVQMSDVKYPVVPVDKNVLTYSAADSAWIPSATLPASTVTATSIVAGALTGGAIAGTPTAGGNIATNTITGGGPTGNIAQATITNTEISAAAAIAGSKIGVVTVGAVSTLPAALPSNLLDTDTLNGAMVKLKDIPQDYLSKTFTGVAGQSVAGAVSFTGDLFSADIVPPLTGTKVVNLNYLTGLGVSKFIANGVIGADYTTGATQSILKTTALSGNNTAIGYDETGAPGYGYVQVTGALNNNLRLQYNGGNVGIGTINPAYLLHVYTATAAATVASFQSGTGSCTITPNAGMACASDLRLKENISEIPNALSKVLALRGVSFQWKERASDDNRRSIGFIAQEVEKVAPELVGEASNGYKQVNYANFVAVVTQAIRELYTKHIVPLWANDKKHDQEIARLSAENKELKARLDNLEKMIIVKANQKR